MYTSKFKIRNGYGLFTIPKALLIDMGWRHGDLLGFWGIDKEIVHLERIFKKGQYQELKKGTKYSWLHKQYSKQTRDVVFIAFNYTDLGRYRDPPKENREAQEKEYKEWLAKEYSLPFFNNRLEISEKNSKRSKRKIVRKNDTISRDRILGLKELTGRLEGGLKKIESSMHPKKKDIIRDVKKNIRELKSKVKELEKNPIKMFKEWQE
jgi:hypothetical protein